MKNNQFMSRGVKYAIAILVVALMTAFLLPIAITPFNDDSSIAISQSVSDGPDDVTANLTANLTAVSGADGTIDVTLEDGSNTATVSAVAQGSNDTATINGETITVENVDAEDTENATVKYSYPTDYGWDGGSSSLFGLFPIFFVLGILLLVVGKATDKI